MEKPFIFQFKVPLIIIAVILLMKYEKIKLKTNKLIFHIYIQYNNVQSEFHYDCI